MATRDGWQLTEPALRKKAAWLVLDATWTMDGGVATTAAGFVGDT